jgi:hypothetical protein
MIDERKCYSDIRRMNNRMTKSSANGIEEENWDVQEKDGEGCCRPNDFFTLMCEEGKRRRTRRRRRRRRRTDHRISAQLLNFRLKHSLFTFLFQARVICEQQFIRHAGGGNDYCLFSAKQKVDSAVLLNTHTQ